MTALAHHVRLSLALNLQFKEDDRAEAMTILIADHVVGLADWLAAALTALLVWLNRLPLDLRRCDAWLDSYLSGPVLSYVEGWAADLALMAEAARTISGRDVLGLAQPPRC